MKNVKVNDTHNFALIGHTGDGKTSARRCSTPPARRRRPVASTTAARCSTTCPKKERRHAITSSVFAFDFGARH